MVYLFFPFWAKQSDYILDLDALLTKSKFKMGLSVRNSLLEGEPCAGPFSASNDKISETTLNKRTHGLTLVPPATAIMLLKIVLQTKYEAMQESVPSVPVIDIGTKYFTIR